MLTLLYKRLNIPTKMYPTLSLLRPVSRDMRETSEHVAIAHFGEIIDEVSVGVQRLVSDIFSINICELFARFWFIVGLKK